MSPDPQRRNQRRHDPREGRDERPIDGPEPDDVSEALQAVLDADIPGTAPIWALRTLDKLPQGKWEVGDRVLRSFSINEGQPQHGAMMSSPHVSRYVVEYPNRCPECGHPTAVFTYRRHHNIAGSETITCEACSHTHHRDEWG